MKNAAVIAMVFWVLPLASKKPVPNWESATITSIQSVSVYEGERDARTNNDVYGGRSRSAAVYAPSQIYTVETSGYSFDVQWTGAANAGGALSYATSVILAGQEPSYFVGQNVQVALSDGYLYIYSGGKKSRGFNIIATRQNQAPHPQESGKSQIASEASSVSVARAAGGPSFDQQTSSLATGKAQLFIDSIPDGAFIELNGKRVGQTPSKFTLDPGQADLKITTSGFSPWNTNLELLADSSVSLKPHLEALPTVSPSSPADQPAPLTQSAQNKTLPPVPIFKVEPTYPAAERKSNISGVVHLRVTVTKDGLPADIQVTKGLSHNLDESAIGAVKQWRFKPAYRDGEPVDYTGTVDLVFYPERK